MRRLFPAILVCCVLASPALADSAFFVQLGSAPSDQEAQAKWKNLQSHYPVLEDLKYASRTVTPVGGGASIFRIQAGPAKSRDDARHICSVLMAKDVECFIVEAAVFEGAPSLPEVTSTSSEQPVAEAKHEEPAPEAKTETKTEVTESAPVKEEAPAPAPEKITAAGDLPWLKKAPVAEAAAAPAPEPVSPPPPVAEAAPAPAAPAPAVAEAEKPIVIPRSHPAPVQAASVTPPPAPPETPAAKGHVEIAEAIPVPLSSDTASQEAREEQREVPAPAIAPAAATAPLKGPDVAWLHIASFASEQDAFTFYEGLQAHVAGGGDMQLRITQPMHLHHQAARAEAAIGPVETAQIASICDYAMRTDPSLRCGLEGSSLPYGGDVSRTALARGPGPEGRYMPALDAGSRGQIGTAPASAPMVRPRVAHSSFYVQLGSWPSKAAAIHHWDDIKEANEALLGQFKPDIHPPARASVDARPTFRLRVGPFPEPDQAESLCDKLDKQGVGCLVVPE